MRHTLALAWELYARQRWLLRGTALGLLLLAAGLQLLPSASAGHVVLWALVGLIAPMVLILTNLTHASSAHVEGRPSLFPRRLFVLPASSSELALAPLAFGTFVMVAVLTVITMVILPACGKVVPVLWPALLGAAALAWVQAMCWMPFPLPWMRFVVLCLTFPFLFFAGFLPSVVAEGVLLTALAASYALAILGVSLARQGAFVAEPPSASGAATGPAQPWRPFASPLAAQLWLEWRVYGWMFLFNMGMALAWLVPAMALVQHLLTQKPEIMEAIFQLIPWTRRVVQTVGNGGVLALMPLGIPLIFVLSGGAGLAHYRRKGFQGEIPSFFLTKPIDSRELVATKWRFAALLMLLALGPALILGLAWAGLQGMLPDTARRLHAAFGPAWWLLLAAALLGLGVMVWMWMSSGLWAGLGNSVSGTLAGPIGTTLFIAGWVTGWAWLSALGVAVMHGPTFQVLRGWRMYVGVAALAVSVVLVFAGWPLLAVPIIPVPGLLAAVPALERRRHG